MFAVPTWWKSLPNNITSDTEILQFALDLATQAEKWNALKLVILGHGEVGKTTLIHAIKRSSLLSRVCNLKLWYSTQ
jgi:hypothetical protein